MSKRLYDVSWLFCLANCHTTVPTYGLNVKSSTEAAYHRLPAKALKCDIHRLYFHFLVNTSSTAQHSKHVKSPY